MKKEMGLAGIALAVAGCSFGGQLEAKGTSYVRAYTKEANAAVTVVNDNDLYINYYLQVGNHVLIDATIDTRTPVLFPPCYATKCP